MKLKRVRYEDLNARQKESYNYQKLSGLLADYGFVTLRLSDDWRGADFIAQHKDGRTFLRIQLKGRLGFYKKYEHKDLWIAFVDEGQWYLYPHDELLAEALEKTHVGKTRSWRERGGYSFPHPTKAVLPLLGPYRIEEVERNKAARSTGRSRRRKSRRDGRM